MDDEKDDERQKALEERFVRATWRLSLDEVKRHVNEAVEDSKEIPSHSERASFLRKQEDVLRPWIEGLKVGDDIWDLPAAEIELERLTRLRVRTENLAMHNGEGSLRDADGHPDKVPDTYAGLPFPDDEEPVFKPRWYKGWLPFGKTILNAVYENDMEARTGGEAIEHIRERLMRRHSALLDKYGLDVRKFLKYHVTRVRDQDKNNMYG